jgi:hypothetical protein
VCTVKVRLRALPVDLRSQDVAGSLTEAQVRAGQPAIGTARTQRRRSSGELEAAVEAEAVVSAGDRTHKNAATRVTEGGAAGPRLMQRANIAGRLGRHSGDAAAAVGVDGFPSRFAFAGVRVPALY